MANARRAIEVYVTTAAIENDSGPIVPHYAIALDRGFVYRWVPNSTLVPDGVTVLRSTGGRLGCWVLVCGERVGADLTGADETVTVGELPIRYIPAASIAANITLSLSTENAQEGQVITICRMGDEAHTVTIKGLGAITSLTTLPPGEKWWADVVFTAGAWRLLRAGQYPA